MKKRGQVTTFAIIAIIIVIGAISAFAIRNYLLKSSLERELERAVSVPVQARPIQSYLTNCLAQITSDAVKIAGLQAGYVTIPTDPLPTTPVNPFSNKLALPNNLNVPYWFYETSNGIQKSQKPKLENIELELASYISDNFPKCLANLTYFTENGYTFNAKEKPSAEVIIKDDSVLVGVNYPLIISLKDFNFELKKYLISVDTKLGQMYKIASNIINKENAENIFEERTLDMLAIYDIPFSGTEFDCNERIWSKQEVMEKLKEIISINIAATVLKGTPYTLPAEEGKYLAIDAGSVKNVNANFMYIPSWPIVVDVQPSDGDILKGDLMTKNIAPMLETAASVVCINNYHFIYSIKYPVLITLYDDTGNIFQFATMVIIKNNQPKQNTIAPEVYETKPILCENPVTETTVYTLAPDAQGILRPLYGADISFKCFTTECPLGKTDLDSNNEASLTEKFPACLNGQIIAKKDGYYKGISTVSTNYPSSTTLILEPYYTKKLNVKLIEKDTGLVRELYDDESIVLELKNKDNDYYTYASYPSETNELALIPGSYEISAYVISKSSSPVVIKGEKIKKCIKVPGTSILGIFLKEEKCIDTTLPEMMIDQVIKGGVKFDFDVTRSLLTSSNKLTMYAMVDKTPTTYDKLSLVYESISQNANNKYFKYPE
ncbi:MAG: hypothetical protein AB1571_03405 [Nanoarchaeota archaeon]